MRRVEKDGTREDRIAREVIVDAYTPEEQALGWYYYLDDKLRFPFEARCIAERTISPLEAGEVVNVIGMPAPKVCRSEMFVSIDWLDRKMGVPLIQLEPAKAGDDTREATADWHYWIERGHQLC